jgi:uncharacterized membrane protein YkvI
VNWRAYLLPGLVFQSVITGGGYATGRELVEFFMPFGPAGGIAGMLAAGVVFAVVTSTACEYAHITGAHDYRTFCRKLLGPGWVIYEIAYIALVILVLAVVGSAAGELIACATGLPAALGNIGTIGTIGMMLLVGALTCTGSTVIGNVLPP